MLKFFVITILALSALADQYTPIPPIPDGYALGSNTPALHVEGFFDLTCDDCKNTWGMLEPILRNEFHITTNQTLRFTFHVYALPFHRYSFLMAQGARVIADNMRDNQDIFTYFDLIFANQANYSVVATEQLTSDQVQQNLVDLVNTNMPAYAEVFANGLTSGNAQDMEARISWKYGVYRGVTGTPGLFANGVAIEGAGSFTADDWRNFLNGGYLQTLSFGYYSA